MTERSPRKAVIWLERALAVAGVVALAWVATSWLDSRLFQARAKAQLEQTLVAQEASAADRRSSRAALEGDRSGLGGHLESSDRGRGAGPTPPGAETSASDESITARRGEGPLDSRRGSGGAPGRRPAAGALPATGTASSSGAGDEGGHGLRSETSRGGPTGEGAPIGLLRAPRVGLSVIVAAGVDRATLRRAVGHLPYTPRPGGEGNAGIAGHRDTHFLPLKDLRIGDEMTLLTPEGTFRYEVEWIRIVEPTATEVLAATDHSALTLITCFPFTYLGDAPHRYIVRARRL